MAVIMITVIFLYLVSVAALDETEGPLIKKDVENETELLVFVVSAPGNLERRKAIRETWLSLHDSEIRGYFVIGIADLPSDTQKAIENDDKEFGDLVLLDMKDSYNKLTEKVLRMLEYADENFNARLFMKCDDDTFVHTRALLREMKEEKYRSPRIYWGYFAGRSSIVKTGKWAETEYNLCDRYIPYALGGGYILGWDVLKHIARMGGMLATFKNEDVSVGTWLAGAKINRIHDQRFDTDSRSRGCLDSYLVTQNKKPYVMRAMWARISTGQTLCKKQYIRWKSYDYDWNVPPHQCCGSTFKREAMPPQCRSGKTETGRQSATSGIPIPNMPFEFERSGKTETGRQSATSGIPIPNMPFEFERRDAKIDFHSQLGALKYFSSKTGSPILSVPQQQDGETMV
eukprot:TRINITY_DN13959_c0_g1_i1.p1 TRINITY_DN13959_c0_g1~~TRINITY_DN13959_c0_g1_i1.p1  ORF type:complete len:414 (-),score=26.26 TRINITY_DN13959_c0_g1_i1:109-1311(-)